MKLEKGERVPEGPFARLTIGRLSLEVEREPSWWRRPHGITAKIEWEAFDFRRRTYAGRHYMRLEFVHVDRESGA